MKVKIKKLAENAVIPFKTHDGDFCYDIVATSEEEVAPNVWRYGTGIALQIERGMEKLVPNRESLMPNPESRELPAWFGLDTSMMPFTRFSIDIRPRSSVWKTGMSMANCEATIDEPYTGEIMIVFYHVMPNMPRYHVGDKIAQMKIGTTLDIDFIEVDELNETSRNANGFGSTDK